MVLVTVVRVWFGESNHKKKNIIKAEGLQRQVTSD